VIAVNAELKQIRGPRKASRRYVYLGLDSVVVLEGRKAALQHQSDPLKAVSTKASSGSRTKAEWSPAE